MTLITKKYIAPAMLAVALGISGAAKATNDGNEFVTMAASSNQFEIESSKLALQKSQDQDIRAFAQKMIEDHEAAGTKMKAAVEKSGLGITPPAALQDKHQDMLDKLREAEAGEDFNDEYSQAQMDAHQEAVALFEEYAEDGDNAALKQFAAETLPTLQQHEDHVEELDAKF